MHLTGWDVVLWIHLLAMALFLGGQLFMGLAIVPVYVAQGGRDGAAHDWMQPIARRFGWASLGAIAVALVTGSMLASHLHVWPETALKIKLTLVAIAVGLTCVHVFVVHGSSRPLQSLILLDSLAIVLAATTL